MTASNLAQRTLTIVLALAAALVLAEVALRVAGVSYPVFDTYDAARGAALRPGKEGWHHGEGEAYLRINRFGYRDEEHSVAKPPGTFRIAILGDSFSEARQVPIGQTFWSHLERGLGECPAFARGEAGERVEVLNFGVGGYGTTQELITLEHDVWRFSPDLVLLAFTPGNDVANNSKELMSDRSWRKDFRPFHLRRGGELVLDESFRHGGLDFWWRRFLYEGVHHLRLLEVVNQARRTWRAMRKYDHSDPVDQAGLEVGLYPETLIPPRDEVWREAWAITEALIARMHAEVRAHGARFVVTTLSYAQQVHPDPERREALRERLGVENLFYPERRLAALGEREGFAVINLAEPLQRVATEHDLFLHGFPDTALGIGHWNADGHRHAGEILTRALCRWISKATGAA